MSRRLDIKAKIGQTVAGKFRHLGAARSPASSSAPASPPNSPPNSPPKTAAVTDFTSSSAPVSAQVYPDPGEVETAEEPSVQDDVGGDATSKPVTKIEADEATGEVWAEAPVVMRPNKKAISLRVDEDVLVFFKKGGRGYQTRMTAVLRQYMDVHEKE